MKIAVLICGLVFDSQKAILKGIERRVRDLKDICAVFCCHANVAGSDGYTKGEYTIFDLPDFSTFDGIIFVRNTFQSGALEQSLSQKIKESGVPCICIDKYDSDFINLLADEKGGMEMITEHLIKEHHCSRFFFVGGTKGGHDTKIRYKGFLSALRKNGIEFSEGTHYFHGNFEYSSGVEAARYFCSLGEKPADAIVCANDQMAVAMMVELKKAGYKIPRDIKVTGCDYDFVSRAYSVKLTTIKRQQYQKGIKAVSYLHELDQHKNGESTVLPLVLNIGESCGCRVNGENHPDVDDTLVQENYVQAEVVQYHKRMSADLMGKSSFESLLKDVRKYAVSLNPKEMYLCTNVRPQMDVDYTDYVQILETVHMDTSEAYASELRLELNCVNGVEGEVGEKFRREDLFPPCARGGREGVTYYFLPIHYMNRNFGYAILGESGDLVRNDFYTMWATATSNAFENTRKQDMMERMISALDRMWIYDTLTGIYNRAGFFKLSEPIIQECIDDEIPICVIFMDVDGLKEVNDKIGHDEGDRLIKDVSDILKGVKSHGQVIMRYGGDEFVLLAADYTQKQAETVISSIEIAMENLNAKAERPYRVEASIGYCITKIQNAEELNNIIEEADHEMYKKKYVKKALKRNTRPQQN